MEKFKKVLTEDFIRSSPIWGSKVKKLLIDKLRSANESAAEGNWGPLVALRNHVALQVQSYRLTSKTQSVPKGDFRLRNLPEAYGRGELYTRPHSNVDENRLVEGLKRSLSFQGVMASTARPDLGIRGGLTATEMRQSEPGYLYTENEFDYLRNIVEEQEAKRKAFQEESNRQWSIYHEKILQLQDPHKLHVESLKKEVGWYYADKILQEEDRQNRIKKDREDNLYRQDMESRHSRMRRQQQAAFQYDTMDEYERFIHEGKKKYGSEEKAQQVWVKKNAKWLEVLAKNNPRIAKHIPQIAKALQTATKIPFVGGIVANPGLAAFGAALLGTKQLIGYLRNVAVQGASASRAGVSLAAARAAEIELKGLGGSQESYTRPIHGYKSSMGKLFRGMGSSDFLADLARFGVDITGSGAGGLATSEEITNNVAAQIKSLYDSGNEDQAIALADTFGFDQSMYIQALRHGKNLNKYLMRNLPLTEQTRREGVQEFGEKITRGWEEFKEGVVERATSTNYDKAGMLEKLEEARRAAESAEVFESQSGSAGDNISNKTSSTGFYINSVEVHANDPNQFASGLASVAESRGIDRISVMDYADSRMVA